MKTIYTILFFLTTLVLIALSFLLLQMIDEGAAIGSMLGAGTAIAAIILILAVLLNRYLKIPPADQDA